jgi:LysM repeat protein
MLKSKKFVKTIAAAAALTAAVTFIVPTANEPVQAATVSSTQSQTLQFNQNDFYNYMAYNALLLKRFKGLQAKMDATSSPSKAKAYLSEMKVLQQKVKSYPTKFKEILTLKGVEISMVDTGVEYESLVVQLITLKKPTNSQLNKILDKMTSLEKKAQKISIQYTGLTSKFIKKYHVKKNASINYVAYQGSDKPISTQSFSYIVKKGDDLNEIAKTYGVNASSIKSWNKLKTSKLTAGQKLKIEIK